MASDDENDRRRERRRIARIASIIYDNAKPAIPCVVLDISDSGAKLHVHAPAEVPDTFRLLLISENVEHACGVVWRTGNEMGVRFTR